MKLGLVIITGASSGIGEAIARLLSAKGHPLLLLARRLDRLEALNLPKCLCEKLDVTDLNAFKVAVEKAQAQFGPTQCLVNNAGVMLLSDFACQDAKEWQTMLDVNVLGVMHGVAAVLPSMLEQGAGTIINVSSIAGQKAFPKHSAYCASKFAVHGYTETLRAEVASKNVRVSLVSPGAVETELLGHTSHDNVIADYEVWKKSIGGALRADDVARAVDYIVSQPAHLCVREVTLAPTRQEA